MFQFTGDQVIEKLQNEIQKIENILETQHLFKKIEQKFENEYENLSHELRRLQQSKEWFNGKIIACIRTSPPLPTKRQAKHRQFKKCWELDLPKNGQPLAVPTVDFLKEMIKKDPNEAKRLVNKLTFDFQVRPNLEIIAKGIEHDLVTFVAEDIW